jgi:hypothetical protein
MRLLVDHALCVGLVSVLRVDVRLLCANLQLGIHLGDVTRRAETRCLLSSSVSISTTSWAGSDPPKSTNQSSHKLPLMFKRSLTSSRLNIKRIEYRKQQGMEAQKTQQLELHVSSSAGSLPG